MNQADFAMTVYLRNRGGRVGMGLCCYVNKESQYDCDVSVMSNLFDRMIYIHTLLRLRDVLFQVCCLLNPMHAMQI